MNHEEIKKLIHLKTGVEITRKFQNISKTDITRLSQLFSEVKEFLPEASYPRFLTNLMIDLEQIHCCAVSTNPASPYYIGITSGVDPISLPRHEIFKSMSHEPEKPIIMNGFF